MSRGKLFSIFVAVLAVTGLSRCAPPEPVLGVVLPESGRAAKYGAVIRDGMNLALDEVNADGGIDGQALQLRFADSATDPATAVAAARTLVEEQGALALIGAVSSHVSQQVAAEVSRPLKVVTLSPAASSPNLRNITTYFFSIYPADSLESARMADLISGLRLRRMAVVASNDEYGAGYARGLIEHYSRKKNREVVATLTFDPEQLDAQAVASALQEHDVQAIFLSGYMEPLVQLLQAIRAAGIDLPVFCSGSVTDQFTAQAGEAAEGVVYSRPSFRHGVDPARTQTFIDAFSARYNRQPDDYAAYGYDAVKLMAQVMRAGARTQDDFLLEVRRQNGKYEGVAGDVLFGNSTDVMTQPTTFIIHQGTPVPYETYLEEGGTPPGSDGAS